MTITNGYCTLAELKARIPITTTDTADDTYLEGVVMGVSRWIDAWCNQRFYSESAITRYYTADFSDVLFVDALQSVTTLSTDSDGDRTYEDTWTATDYDLEPVNNSQLSAPYWMIRVSPLGGYSFPVGIQRGVKIVGVWGWASVPTPVKEACMLQSQRLWTRRNAPFGVAGSSATGQTFLLPALDPDVQILLRGYRRLTP